MNLAALRTLKPRDVAQAVLIPLLIGWAAALVLGLWVARLQYVELIKLNQDGDGVYPDSRWWVARVQNPDVDHAYPPARIAVLFQERLDREVWHGPLVSLLQIGVIAGALVWQAGITARRAPHQVLHGGTAGVILGLLQGAIAVIMQVPWAFTVSIVGILIGAGLYAGWSAKAS